MQKTSCEFRVTNVPDGQYDAAGIDANEALKKQSLLQIGANMRDIAVLVVNDGLAQLFYTVEAGPPVDVASFQELEEDIEHVLPVAAPVRDTNVTAGLGRLVSKRPMETAPSSAPTESEVAIGRAMVESYTFEQLQAQARELKVKGWQLFKEEGLRRKVAEALS